MRKNSCNNNSPFSRTLYLAHVAVMSCIVVASAGALGLSSCATTAKGLAREQAIHDYATNAIAVVQPVVQAAPAPTGQILGAVLAGVSGLLALWQTHLHRTVAALSKTNGQNPSGPPAPTG